MPEKPFIIPVFLPHAGCPHQCAFCNQKAITGQGLPSDAEIRKQIQTFLGYRKKQYRSVQISFYGGNFLGLDRETVFRLLDLTREFTGSAQVNSLRFSTRPDTITPERLDRLRDFPVATVEIGAQSMNDRVLRLAMRGHTAADTAAAVRHLRERGYETGLQMMVGLPGETPDNALASARAIADLEPDFVRIYPTLVLAGSPLARWFREGKYAPPELEPCVKLVSEIYLLFRERGIPVIRTGLQASADLDDTSIVLAGPYHPAFGHMVQSEIFLKQAIALLEKNPPESEIRLAVHPRHISALRGLKNRNVEILEKMFHNKKVRILPDPDVPETGLRISDTFR